MSDPEADELEQAMENTEPIIELGKNLADAAVSDVARRKGRTPDEQLRRMGDRFAYIGAEQNPNQSQLHEWGVQ